MISGYTDGCKLVFLGGERVVVVSNSARNREGELVAETVLANPEGLGLKFGQGGLNEVRNDIIHKN